MSFKLYPHQQYLVDKSRQAFMEGYKFPAIISPCGSGKSIIISDIARKTTDNGKRVLFLVHRKELIDQIRDTFRKNKVNLNLVEFGMVQTVTRKLDRMETPDLIITDESHHSLAKSYTRIYEHFEDVLKLGFTATPIRLNGSGLGDVNDTLIQGESVQWLIDNNYLTPFKYYAPQSMDTTQLKLNSMKEFSNTSISNAMDRKIYGDAVKHYQKLTPNEKAIVYCHSIESSIATAQAFNEADIPAAHIDGKTPKLERDEIIQKFRTGEIQVLSNVEIIGEGFDVPDCSTVILLRPTKSLSLFIQMAMRGMRYKPNKISTIIDHVGNVNEHGLPNAEHKWGLDGLKKNSKENTVKVKTCDMCLFTWIPESPIERKCPNCGHEEEIEEKKSEMDVDSGAELQEVEESAIVLDFRQPEDCKNMKELYELAKNKKYKPGWAYVQAKRMGWL